MGISSSVSFSFKDIVSRVIATRSYHGKRHINVMTLNPELLRAMHDHTILTLPVWDANGRMVGLVDVMDDIYGCVEVPMGARSILDSAMDLRDNVLGPRRKEHCCVIERRKSFYRLHTAILCKPVWVL